MIIVSGRYRGPELKGSRIANAVAATMKAVEVAREPKFGGSLGMIPHLNAVFVVEGSLGKPNFHGVRLGPYNKRDKCIQVDVAISTLQAGESNLRDLLIIGLRGANAAAFHFFESKGMEYALGEGEELVTHARMRLDEFACM